MHCCLPDADAARTMLVSDIRALEFCSETGRASFFQTQDAEKTAARGRKLTTRGTRGKKFLVRHAQRQRSCQATIHAAHQMPRAALAALAPASVATNHEIFTSATSVTEHQAFRYAVQVAAWRAARLLGQSVDKPLEGLLGPPSVGRRAPIEAVYRTFSHSAVASHSSMYCFQLCPDHTDSGSSLISSSVAALDAGARSLAFLYAQLACSLTARLLGLPSLRKSMPLPSTCYAHPCMVH